jgi:hypothetical protein
MNLSKTIKQNIEIQLMITEEDRKNKTTDLGLYRE